MTTITIYSHWRDDPTGLAGPRLSDPTWTGSVTDASLSAIYAEFNIHSDADTRRLRAVGYWLASLSVGDVVILNSDTDAATYHLVDPVGFRALEPGEYLRIRRSANPFQAAEQMAWFRSLAAIA